MTDPTPGPPPGWGTQPPPQWGPPVPPPGWPPPPPPAWPPPPPPRRTRTGLVVALGLTAAGLLLGGMVVVGVLVARERPEDATPRARIDHWHAAYGVYLCDRYLAPVEGEGDQAGIHSHGDGIVHVEPLNRTSAGSNAVFRRFEEAQRMRITSSSLRWVDGVVPVEAEARDGCGGRPAEIASFVDGKRVGGAPGRIRLRDGQVIVVALVPQGTTYAQIGPPPSAAYLPRVRGLVP